MREITDLAAVRARFDVYLRLERGLSANTAAAYGEDVVKLANYLSAAGIDVARATPDELEQFVGSLQDVGITARSQARIISGIKSFYRFLQIEGYIDVLPTQLLPTPRLGRHLPDGAHRRRNRPHD